MRERDRQKERAASSGQYWFLCRNLFTCNEQRDTFTQGRIANEEIDLRAWWYECEKSTVKYTLPKTFSSPLMKIGLTIYICWLREKMYSQSHSDTWEDEFWKMNSQSPPECVIAFPPLSCWEVSVKAENQHTHISALLTFNRLHLMHCAESEIRFNCGFDVLLRINQSPECGGYDYLTFIFSIRGSGGGHSFTEVAVFFHSYMLLSMTRVFPSMCIWGIFSLCENKVKTVHVFT